MEENKNQTDKDIKKEIVSRTKLLEAGVYFGTRKSQWNPNMKPYILTTKKGSHIIDIQKTKKALEFAYQIIYKFAQKGANFIFVGTKKQAKKTIRENALRTNSLYVSERWLGGTLTNSRTIFRRVKRLAELEKLSENNFENYTKKEGVMFQKELNKLNHNLSGIRHMKQKPNVMIVADPIGDAIAIKEAQKLGIKIIGITDTNVNPNDLDIFIPGNDDSIKSITLIITILADAIASAKNGRQIFAYQNDEDIVLPQEKVSEFKKRRFDNTSFRRRSANFVRREDRVEIKSEDKKTEIPKQVDKTISNKVSKEKTVEVKETKKEKQEVKEIKAKKEE